MKKFQFLGVYCTAIALVLSSQAKAASDTITVEMNPFQDVEVVAQRVQQTTLSHNQISDSVLNRENTGQNLPYLLSTIPALQVTSDDGLGVGYTYFRLRGTDHTRINMTVNDVPLNDQESQTVFWVNMTDMASSLTSIDVQRGVGTSTNGSSSFGGSLNMRTLGADTVSHFTLGFNGGMYKTFKEMAQAHIVMPNKRWQMNARFSKVNSDGFLYRTSSDLYSYHGDLGYYGDKTQVVLSVFGGSEKTGMGWDGVDYNTAYGIDGADRRYNPAGEYYDAEGKLQYYDNQTDNYAQQHAQLNIAHRFNANWTLNATAHYTHGGGYYEQMEDKKFAYFGLDSYKKTIKSPKTGNDTIVKIKGSNEVYRKYLNNHFAGAIISAKYVSEAVDVQFGGAGNYYTGQHYGSLLYIQDETYPQSIPYGYEYYRSTGNKTDINIYAKANWRVINRAQEKLSLYADLQYRYVGYRLAGRNGDALKSHYDDGLDWLNLNTQFHFFNPKAGLTYENHGHLLYGSFAIANREPARDNYTENVLYDRSTDQIINPEEMPKAERLYDYELGYTYSHPRFTIGANLYFMDYDNQLVLTGEYNDVGKYLTKNVKDSYRMGAEITAGVKITNWFRWDGNIVISRNKIQNYKQYIDRYDNQDDWNWVGTDSVCGEVTIAFSPMVTAMSLFTFDTHGFVGTIQTNVTSRQYLDNTMDENAMLKAYTTTNVNLQYSLPMKKWAQNTNHKYLPEIKLLCQLNNIFNMKYASNGGAEASRFEDGSRCVWYYAQAGFNVHAGFVINW